jgi:hypothetical protein
MYEKSHYPEHICNCFKFYVTILSNLRICSTYLIYKDNFEVNSHHEILYLIMGFELVVRVLGAVTLCFGYPSSYPCVICTLCSAGTLKLCHL